MNSKQQGDTGVAMALAHYTSKGYTVSIPATDNSRYDLVVEAAGVLHKIQCKTTRYSQNGKYIVQLRTCGGNQSWSKVIKKISAKECDLLFVFCIADGRCYEFPSSVFDGKSTLSLGNSAEPYFVWDSNFKGS